jgi:hypothetical protein
LKPPCVRICVREENFRGRPTRVKHVLQFKYSALE